MSIRESSYGYWSGDTAFVIVAAVAGIGIGSITRLPALAGEYGGGVFVLCYLAALLVLGWPLLLAELMLGRWCRRSVVPGFERLALASGAGRGWSVIGWMMLAAGVMVLAYTSVIAGWSLAYVLRSAAGGVSGESPPALLSVFHYLARDPERSLAWHTMFMMMACIVVGHGIRDGVERGARYLMTLAGICLLGLLWFTLGHGDVPGAVERMFLPRPGDFGWRGFLEAVHMAFFSATVGLGVMYAFGHYVPARSPMPALSAWVVLIMGAVSVVGGLAVTAILLPGGNGVGNGLVLIFQSLPAALPSGWGGVWPAVMFYGLLACVALASGIALLESLTLRVMERMRTTRVFAATSSAVFVWLLGIGCLLSFNVLSDWQLFGRTLFGWLQWATVTVLAPSAALLLCVFVVRIMPPGLRDEAWGAGGGALRGLWVWLLRFPARVLLIALLLYGLGLVQAVVKLWN